ncbi:MAG: glucosamine-6-phosphate deaminase [Candidatus Cloacimonetes bacterium]|nr:glucosamine-6-phosphate deaminase [Candidatus Cloacimonadota bacterium]
MSKDINPKNHTYQFGSNTAVVYETIEEMGQAAAHYFVVKIKEVLRQKDTANIVLATGNSMLTFLKALRQEVDIDWSRINIFHLDEYLGMADTHPASFRRYLHENIVDHVKPLTFNEIVGDAWDVTKECVRYESLLKEKEIDICCLGIGENGHIAFNDPPVADFNDPFWVKVVALDDACRLQQVGEGHFASLDDTPSHAITMTISALFSAKNILAIVPEERKAKAVKMALTGSVDTSCPASILQRIPQVKMFLDMDSAAKLTNQ